MSATSPPPYTGAMSAVRSVTSTLRELRPGLAAVQNLRAAQQSIHPHMLHTYQQDIDDLLEELTRWVPLLALHTEKRK
jgi:hypothetical protein